MNRKYDKEVFEEYAASVGDYFEENQIWTPGHPAYQAFAQDVSQELSKLAEEKAARDAAAKPLLMTIALDSESLALLASEYPEYKAIVVPINRPVHAYWHASRLAANEWIYGMTQRYSNDILHYGGSLMGALMRGTPGTHNELDPSDEIMLHERYTGAVDVQRLFQNYAAVQQEYEVNLPRGQYEAYVAGDAYGHCEKPAECTKAFDGMCVDLTATALSPVQVAATMMQHSTDVCHGFFIYHPSMLVQKKGELPGTGIQFSRGVDNIRFDYTEGRAGVISYPRTTWACWLSSHCFSIGEGETWFQLELLNNRGSFMFFRLVRLDMKPENFVFRHALELQGKDEYTLVHSWKLKDGLYSDPGNASSWEPNPFLIRSRIERRVREFAMQATPETFTRYAIKKQIRVANNRFVTAGTSVIVNPPLDQQQIEDLTTAIYAKAFVDRYDSSRLTKEMMSALKDLTAFNSASVLQRVCSVACTVFFFSVRHTLGYADEFMRYMCDGILSFLTGNRKLLPISTVQAPTYVSFTSVVNKWSENLMDNGEYMSGCSNHAFVTPIVPHTAGSLVMQAVKHSVLGTAKAVGKLLVEAGSIEEVVASGLRPSDQPGPDCGVKPTEPRSVGVDLQTAASDLENVCRVVTDLYDVRTAEDSERNQELIDAVARLDTVEAAPTSRHYMSFSIAERESQEAVQRYKDADDPDPVDSLNAMYSNVLPSVASQDLQYDPFSLSLDPQDRVLVASYLRMPTYFGLPPPPRAYYLSRLKALNIPKRSSTVAETLAAITARNLAAPNVAEPQDEPSMAREVWENFLVQFCTEDAKEKLASYQSDPVGLSEQGLTEWAKQCKSPEVVARVVKDLVTTSKSLGERPVDEYIAMIKSDMKPTLSNKPVKEYTNPQVIVYHDKPLSALYSSMFRALVRRFLSLLKPNIHVNLLKDTGDIASFIQQNHPFSKSGLKYLENDFSKYDKSQARFAFFLENYVFQQLGLNPQMLEKWSLGHVDCSIRSISLGISLHVMYQRKSGDATTAFGNVILNVLSVAYAYQGTKMHWAVFMGDDSLACASDVCVSDKPVTVMSEVFNLSAKYYITEAPYFASNFVVIRDFNTTALLVPDPVKRVERMSMHVTADEPQWRERHTSFKDSMAVYRDSTLTFELSKLVAMRYPVEEGLVRGSASALGTLVRDYQKFRNMWEEKPTIIHA